MDKIEWKIKAITTFGFDEALEKLAEAMKGEGFGLLTKVDAKATFKKKIDVDFRNYQILGFCNPKIAIKVLEGDPDFGVFLPCTVVVYEQDDGKVVITGFNPGLMNIIPGATDEVLKQQTVVKEKFLKVIGGLGEIVE